MTASSSTIEGAHGRFKAPLGSETLFSEESKAMKHSTMPKRPNKAHRAAMLDIIQSINDETLTSMSDLKKRLADDGLPSWYIDWPLWSAGENMPFYMPDSPYCLVLTESAARGYCRELDRDSLYVTDYMPTSLREILNPVFR